MGSETNLHIKRELGEELERYLRSKHLIDEFTECYKVDLTSYRHDMNVPYAVPPPKVLPIDEDHDAVAADKFYAPIRKYRSGNRTIAIAVAKGINTLLYQWL